MKPEKKLLMLFVCLADQVIAYTINSPFLLIFGSVFGFYFGLSLWASTVEK